MFVRSPLKCGGRLLAWDRGDTRIAYVVKVVRYAGRAATQIGGRLPVGFIGGSLPQRF